METPTIESPSSPTPPTLVDLCALCREPKTEPEEVICGHSFCRECLVNLRSCHQKWGRCCPLCRRPIVPHSESFDDELIGTDPFDEERPMLFEEEELSMFSETDSDYMLDYLINDEDVYYYTASETDTEEEEEEELEQTLTHNAEEPADNQENQFNQDNQNEPQA